MFLYYPFTSIPCSLLEFLDDHINIPIPSIKRKIPDQEVMFKYSSNNKTPNSAAVNGSANASVTAVDEETFTRPLAKRRYAIPVATIPS